MSQICLFFSKNVTFCGLPHRSSIMKLPKRTLPAVRMGKEAFINQEIKSLPFYVKEAGFSNSRRFVRGKANNYSDYLLLYSLTSMTFTKHNVRYPVNPDDVIFSSCNTPLTFSQPWNREKDFLYIVISGAQAQHYYNMIRKSNSLFHTNQLSNILDHFLSLFEIDYPSSRNALLNQLEAGVLIHQLLLDLYKLSQNILAAKDLTPVQDNAVNTAIRYIQENYQSDLDIDTICNSISFSKYYFCKLFKEHTGMTVHQYVTEFRINKSKELLSYSKLSIAAVANSVGFKNTLTYTRSFEKLVHMTPSEYRKYY